MLTSPSSPKPIVSALWFGFKCLLNGLAGAVVGLLIWYALWSHWDATVYQPWLANELAQGRDDGGSSEGWVLLLGITPAFRWGFIAGVSCFLVFCAWKRKRHAPPAPS